MALKFVIDKLEDAPEAMRGLYAEKDGKFVLDLEGYEDPAGLKSALVKERTAAKEAADAVKAWKALGKTPDEIAALVATEKANADKAAAAAGEWDKLKSSLNETHKGELSARDKVIAAKDAAMTKHLVEAAAVTAIATAKGSAALLLPHIRSSVKVVEENGEYVVRVVDKAGSPRINAKGEFLSIPDLVSEMRQSDDYSRAFDASGTTGSGAGGSPAGAGTGTKTVSSADKAAIGANLEAIAKGTVKVT